MRQPLITCSLFLGRGALTVRGLCSRRHPKTGQGLPTRLWPRMSRKARRPRGRSWCYQVLTATPAPPSGLTAGKTAVALRGSDPTPSIL